MKSSAECSASNSAIAAMMGKLPSRGKAHAALPDDVEGHVGLVQSLDDAGELGGRSAEPAEVSDDERRCLPVADGGESLVFEDAACGTLAVVSLAVSDARVERTWAMGNPENLMNWL